MKNKKYISIIIGGIIAIIIGGIVAISKKTYSPQEYHKMLGIGIDVDWAKTKKGIASYSSKDPQIFKKRGFSHVRIRVKDDISNDLLDQLEKVVKDCLDAGLIPIISYKAEKFKIHPTKKEETKAIEWWNTVATRFAHFPAELSFELMIEPSDAINKHPNILNDYYEKAVTQIRQTNPNRILFISPIIRSAPENLHLLKIPSHANGFLMAEWHFYASGPSKTNPKKLWTTGKTAEKEILITKFTTAKNWEEKTGIKTWVGEWMPGNYNKGNNYSIKEQITFATFVTKKLFAYNIPFAVSTDTKFYERETHQWKPEMQKLLDVIIENNAK